MKITLTHNEAKQYIISCLRATGLNVLEIEIEIGPVNQPIQNLHDLDIINGVLSLDYFDRDKIEAIKYFRKETGNGLAQSKWAIENFSFVTNYFQKHRKLPGINAVLNVTGQFSHYELV